MASELGTEFDSLEQAQRDAGKYTGAHVVPAIDAKELIMSAIVPDADWSADKEDLTVILEASSDDGETWLPVVGFGAGKGVPVDGLPSVILSAASLRGKRIRAVLDTKKRMTVGIRIDTL